MAFYVMVLIVALSIPIFVCTLWPISILSALGIGASISGALTALMTRRSSGDLAWGIGMIFSLVGLLVTALSVLSLA
jgi:hypothetical protein